MCDKKCHIEGGCPFSFSEESEMIQNYGCLPAPYDIVNMAKIHGRKWACHSNPEKPCKGAIDYLKKNNIEVKYIDAPLLTEESDWHLFVK